jgi:3-methyladenine DNA glycosylase Tag
MEAPEQIRPRGPRDYLDVMSKAVFQSGMSWKVVEAKWAGIRDAFRDFDPEALIALSPDEVDALAQDGRIIRNRRKVEGIIANARTITALEREHGSFRGYLGSHGGFEETVKDLRKRFKFLGDFGAYYFLYVVQEPVPDYHLWCASRGREPAMAG